MLAILLFRTIEDECKNDVYMPLLSRERHSVQVVLTADVNGRYTITTRTYTDVLLVQKVDLQSSKFTVVVS